MTGGGPRSESLEHVPSHLLPLFQHQLVLVPIKDQLGALGQDSTFLGVARGQASCQATYSLIGSR